MSTFHLVSSNIFILSAVPIIMFYLSIIIAGPAGTMSASDSIHFEYIIPDGCTRLDVRPIQDGTCNPRRALQIPLE